MNEFVQFVKKFAWTLSTKVHQSLNGLTSSEPLHWLDDEAWGYV